MAKKPWKVLLGYRGDYLEVTLVQEGMTYAQELVYRPRFFERLLGVTWEHKVFKVAQKVLRRADEFDNQLKERKQSLRESKSVAKKCLKLLNEKAPKRS